MEYRYRSYWLEGLVELGDTLVGDRKLGNSTITGRLLAQKIINSKRIFTTSEFSSSTINLVLLINLPLTK